jgi:glycosyltransferase involved in cell wall biosynthesis
MVTKLEKSLSDLSVLNVYKTYFPDPPGGIQEAIKQLCLASSQFSIKNTVFSLSPNNSPSLITRQEALVVREKSWLAPASCDIGGYSAFKTYSSLAKRSDIIHYLHPWPFADLLNLSAPTNKPKVLTYVSDVVRQKHLNTLYSPLMWKHLQNMDVIIANCPAYADTSPILSNKLIRDKVRIIPLGIDDASYLTESDDSILSKGMIEEDEPYFLFLGVHRYYKGLHNLINAAQYTSAKIIIAGSGPKTDELISQANKLNLRNVIFMGQVSDAEKISLIKHCRAFILPSHLRSEAYGMVLVEASLMSKPLISCEIGTGTSYINLNDQTGFVVNPNAPHELAEAINQLFKDQSLAIKMGNNARNRYEQLFSGPAMGKAYADLYHQLT